MPILLQDSEGYLKGCAMLLCMAFRWSPHEGNTCMHSGAAWSPIQPAAHCPLISVRAD